MKSQRGSAALSIGAGMLGAVVIIVMLVAFMVSWITPRLPEVRAKQQLIQQNDQATRP